MGWFGFGRKRGRARVIRADYRQHPESEWSDDEVDHYMAHCTDDEYWAWWDRWSLDKGEHPRIKHIKRSVLDMALAASADSFPHEFGAMLRTAGDTITELIVIPIIQGDAHTIMFTNQLPVDRSVQGTLHSHPDPHPYPSDADFAFFEGQGTIHLILAEPYGPNDWRAYDHAGRPVRLTVVA